MRSAKRIGQTIGILIFVQLVCGLLVSFVFLSPLTERLGFLENAAGSSLQLSMAVVLWFVAGALSIAIAVTAWPIFSRYSSAMALWFLSLAVASFSLFAVENATVMSMLSLSQAYAAEATPDQALFKAMGTVVRSAYVWVGNTSALVAEALILLHYWILYRFALVPRALSAFGLVAVLMKIIGIAMPFFGYGVVMLMVLPMVLGYVALALWLMAKGFEDRPDPLANQ
ncbi:MAG: DUF4386 domain-containing protein [Pyrinomonadaceae bacterium]|nr:DUF4386 domain-containing protein [Pyrinomonadaceae bacterium]